MQQNIVKILEGDVDVTELSEGNIAEYVQTAHTIQALKKLVIEPFKNYATEKGESEVYKDNKVTVSVSEKVNEKTHTDKEVISLLETTLEIAQRNRANGKLMYGVKKFDDVTAMDAEYLADLFTAWQDMTFGESIQKTVTYKGKGAKEVAADYTGKLVLATNGTLIVPEVGEELTESIVYTYIAADKQVKLLAKKVIKPFETAFKDNAEKSKAETVFDNRQYGGLIVQVKSVPRDEADFEKIKGKLAGMLQQYAVMNESQVDGELTFFNTDLLVPRAYVSIPGMLNAIHAAMDKTETKFRQEISILYAPTKATIIAE